MKLTEITARGLEVGAPFFGFTRCPNCKKIFADGIEGGADCPSCDKCWEINK